MLPNTSFEIWVIKSLYWWSCMLPCGSVKDVSKLCGATKPAHCMSQLQHKYIFLGNFSKWLNFFFSSSLFIFIAAKLRIKPSKVMSIYFKLGYIRQFDILYLFYFFSTKWALVMHIFCVLEQVMSLSVTVHLVLWLCTLGCIMEIGVLVHKET